MSIEKVTERIISDAEQAAAATLESAQKKAEEIVAEAQTLADRAQKGAEAEVAAKAAAILEGRTAQARLDGAKALLAEKRRVIDSVYQKVLKELNKLPKREALLLAQSLLEKFAEEGDEICFAADYPYAKEVSALDEVKRKKLKIKLGEGQVEGGFVLHGKISDKDVSFAALVAADREEHQAELAASIFNG